MLSILRLDSIKFLIFFIFCSAIIAAEFEKLKGVMGVAKEVNMRGESYTAARAPKILALF